MNAVGWGTVLLFAGTVLTATLYGLALSGHFPADQRTAELRTRSGSLTIWGTMPIVVVALLMALGRASAAAPWPALVLAGGTAVLVAPLLLQRFPDRFVDGRRGLTVLAGASAVLAAFTLRAGSAAM